MQRIFYIIVFCVVWVSVYAQLPTQHAFAGTFNVITYQSSAVSDFYVNGFFNDVKNDYAESGITSGYILWDVLGNRFRIDSVEHGSVTYLHVTDLNSAGLVNTGIGAIIQEDNGCPFYVAGVSDELNNRISEHAAQVCGGSGSSVVDSTRLVQDSILAYYQNGTEIGRDTIPVSLGGGSAGMSSFYWGSDGSSVASITDMDTITVIGGANGIDATLAGNDVTVLLDLSELYDINYIDPNFEFAGIDMSTGIEQRVSDDEVLAWINVNHIVSTNATLSGDGNSSSPLTIAQQGAVSGQVLKWDGSTWLPSDDYFEANTDAQTLSASTVANDVTITISGGNSVTFSRDDGDSDPANEVNTSATLSGTSLQIVDSGGTVTADLSSLEESQEVIDTAASIRADIPVSISDFDDVDTAGVADGDILKWSAADAAFIMATDNVGSGGNGEANVGSNVGAGAEIYKTKTDTTLVFRSIVATNRATITQNVDDVTIDVQPQNIDLLTYSTTTEQLSISLDDVGTTATSLSALEESQVIIDTAQAIEARRVKLLSDLSDVSNTAPSSGQVLKWDGSTWSPANDDTGGGSTVVTDATLTGDGSAGNPLGIAQQGATSGQVLKWDGSTWSPANDDAGSGGDNLGDHVATQDLEMSDFNILHNDTLTWSYGANDPSLGIYRYVVGGKPSLILDNFSNTTRELKIKDSGVEIFESYTLPTSDGTNGQVMITNGAGTLSWQNVVGDNLGNHTATQNLNMSNFDIINANAISFDLNAIGGTGYVRRINGGEIEISIDGNEEIVVGDGTVRFFNQYNMPGLDGNAGQVLTTDGIGGLYWSNSSGDNLGNHTATQALNMSGFDIQGISIATFYDYDSGGNTWNIYEKGTSFGPYSAGSLWFQLSGTTSPKMVLEPDGELKLDVTPTTNNSNNNVVVYNTTTNAFEINTTIGGGGGGSSPAYGGPQNPGVTSDATTYVEFWRDTIDAGSFTSSNKEWYSAELMTHIVNNNSFEFIDLRVRIDDGVSVATAAEYVNAIRVAAGDDEYGKLELTISTDPDAVNDVAVLMDMRSDSGSPISGGILTVDDITGQIIVILECRWDNNEGDYLDVITDWSLLRK